MTLDDVILRHGGESQASRDAYAKLSGPESDALQKFLNSLILFPPDDTASNLDPGNRSTPGFPQLGHGSIKLTVLFMIRRTLNNQTRSQFASTTADNPGSRANASRPTLKNRMARKVQAIRHQVVRVRTELGFESSLNLSSHSLG